MYFSAPRRRPLWKLLRPRLLLLNLPLPLLLVVVTKAEAEAAVAAAVVVVLPRGRRPRLLARSTTLSAKPCHSRWLLET